ncbi:MAG: tyrosine--tRNA ligase [Alphaproteobacteria bacterium]|nr:tyrosine--tRNA ligase [Alphaproteobacteria bacterium]
MSLHSPILHILFDRGFIHQTTDEATLDALLAKENVTFYVGFDCTADSLHVGSLIQLMMVRHFQKQGHKPIILLGGGTTKVGDPSGKDESRKLLTDEIIAANIAGIKRTISKFVTFGDSGHDAILVNNADWLSSLGYIDFLRDIGSHFSVNRMLTFDSVRLRLEREQNLSFLEFNYMLLQAYDFAELNKRHQCRLQLGGSDQWGNIVNGVELNRRLGLNESYGLTTPLLTTASGAKMGKTAQGAIWLDNDKLSAYDYWQFWRNTDDRDVGRFLRLFTELPLADIIALEDRDINEAKKRLATEATALCHGRDAANHAEETARKTFEEHQLGDNLPTYDLTDEDLNLPAYHLFKQVGLVASSSEARRLIEGGGGKINDLAIADPSHLTKDLLRQHESPAKLSAGKKKHVRVQWIRNQE